jgi:3-hydroxyacyl-CoA dehydrogenase
MSLSSLCLLHGRARALATAKIAIATRDAAKAATRSFTSTPSLGQPFHKVGVVGLGLMGHGIAQVAASCGKHQTVVAFEPEQKYLEGGKARIEGSIDKLVKKEKLSSAQAEAILHSIQFTTDFDALKDADFIVEAVIENMDLKRDLYGKLGSICKQETIFASNTSSLSIAEMAAFSGRPQNFCGVHFL